MHDYQDFGQANCLTTLLCLHSSSRVTQNFKDRKLKILIFPMETGDYHLHTYTRTCMLLLQLCKFFVFNLIIAYSLMNIRQLHSLFNHAKTWHGIVCWFLCIYLFLPVFAWCAHKMFLSAEQFYEHIMQELVKTDK